MKKPNLPTVTFPLILAIKDLSELNLVSSQFENHFSYANFFCGENSRKYYKKYLKDYFGIDVKLEVIPNVDDYDSVLNDYKSLVDLFSFESALENAKVNVILPDLSNGYIYANGFVLAHQALPKKLGICEYFRKIRKNNILLKEKQYEYHEVLNNFLFTYNVSLIS